MRVRAFPLRFSASAPGFGSHRHPPPPNNSFKPTPCRGVSCVLCATLARIRRPATGRLNSSVRRQKSVCVVASSALQLIVFGQHCSSGISSARCFFGQVCLARSHIACVTLAGFGNGSGCLQFSTTETVASVTTSGKFASTRPGSPASFFRQMRQDPTFIGIHRHLTIRSSRPHVVASAACFTLRLHASAAPPRGGLTQALGVTWSNPYAQQEKENTARLDCWLLCHGYRSSTIFVIRIPANSWDFHFCALLASGHSQ